MLHENSSYPADWLRIAERDWDRVGRLLTDGDFSLAGFCLQQAIEKFLKAFLIYHGWELRFIHNLDALLDDAVCYDLTLEEFRDICQKITAFYFIERYPLLIEEEITEDDVRDCFKKAEGFVNKLRI